MREKNRARRVTLDERGVVGGHYDRRTRSRDGVEQFDDAVRRDGIEVSCRFVGKYERRRVEQCTCYDEALLFAADRAQHVAEVIRPALERGAVVITDRYLDSSLAYQAGGRELTAGEIRDLSMWATCELLPNRTYLLDLSLIHISEPTRPY